MFGLQFSEIVIILILALVLLGPERLPKVARGLARGLKEVRRATQDLRDAWESEVEHTAGPELRALRKLRDPGTLVDEAWKGGPQGTADEAAAPDTVAPDDTAPEAALPDAGSDSAPEAALPDAGSDSAPEAALPDAAPDTGGSSKDGS